MEYISYEYLQHLLEEQNARFEECALEFNEYGIGVSESYAREMEEYEKSLLAEITRRDKLGIKNPETVCHNPRKEDNWVCKCKYCKHAKCIQRWWNKFLCRKCPSLWQHTHNRLCTSCYRFKYDYY